MYYLRVEWTDGSDADLFRFKTLEEAIKYIKSEGITDFILSDRHNAFMANQMIFSFNISDYTFVGEDKRTLNLPFEEPDK